MFKYNCKISVRLLLIIQSFNCRSESYLAVADCHTVAVSHVYRTRWAYKIRSVCSSRLVYSIRLVWCRKLLLIQLLNLIANYLLQNPMLGYSVEIVVFPVQCSAFETILVVEVELKLKRERERFVFFLVCIQNEIGKEFNYSSLDDASYLVIVDCIAEVALVYYYLKHHCDRF